MKRNLLYPAIVLLLSCCKGNDKAIPADALASVGDDVITRRDMQASIPAGLSPDDSTTFAKAYLRSWIETRLVERVAANEVDMELIDRLTREYRDELIMSQYRRSMAQQADNAAFPEDSLKAYYDAHVAEFKLERPMVKGVYLKVPTEASDLRQIKRLYRSDRPADIDKLDKAANSSAIHYDYFRDTWIDWEQIENRIPLEFDAQTLAGITQRRYLETEAQGFTYLLSISDYLPAGTAMPYEAARPIVLERLLNLRRRAYDSRLRNDLYNRALDDGTLIIY